MKSRLTKKAAVIYKLLILSLCTFPSALHALEIDLGVEMANKSIWIEEPLLGGGEIARMDSGNSYQPSLAIHTNPDYIWDDDNWGYHYQMDFSTFYLPFQEDPDTSELSNQGTSLSGNAIYAMPVGYYHFNRHDLSSWNYKAGIGVGVGYMDVSGTFKITQPHPEIGTIKHIDYSGYGFSVGVYFEAAKGNHTIIVQNYSPVVSDGPYDYQQMNLILAYRYSFNAEEIIHALKD